MSSGRLAVRNLMVGALLGVFVGGCSADGPAPNGATAATPPADAPAAKTDPGSPDVDGAMPAAVAPEAHTDAAPEPAAEDPEKPAQPDPGAEAPAAADDAGETPPEEPAAVVEPKKVLILGDSLAATGFGAVLQKRLDAHPEVKAYRKGKSASGLARPDYFDWPDEAKRQIEFRKPDVVIVIMGGNDGQDLTRSTGKGKRVRWKTGEWPGAYRQRMDSFLASLSADGRKVIWLGLPKMGMRSLEKKLEMIRGIQKDAVVGLGTAGSYLDTTHHIVGDDGELLEYVRVRRKKQKLRADDGIHFTMSGSQFLAGKVAVDVMNVLGVSPVEE